MANCMDAVVKMVVKLFVSIIWIKKHTGIKIIWKDDALNTYSIILQR